MVSRLEMGSTVVCLSPTGSSNQKGRKEENGEGEDDAGGRPREGTQMGATRAQETDAEAVESEDEVCQDEDEMRTTH
jgi:hypothetical protein